MSPSLIRQDVLPVGVGYLLVMGALGTGLWLIRRQHGDAAAANSEPDREADMAPGSRDREAGADAGTGTADPRPDWLRLARHYAGTAIGGYLLLMAVVIGYYYGVARVGGAFVVSAFTGCALLIALSTPVYAVASWLTVGRRALNQGQGPVGGEAGVSRDAERAGGTGCSRDGCSGTRWRQGPGRFRCGRLRGWRRGPRIR